MGNFHNYNKQNINRERLKRSLSITAIANYILTSRRVLFWNILPLNSEEVGKLKKSSGDCFITFKKSQSLAYCRQHCLLLQSRWGIVVAVMQGAVSTNFVLHIVSVLDRKTSLNWYTYPNAFQEKYQTVDRGRKGETVLQMPLHWVVYILLQ